MKKPATKPTTFPFGIKFFLGSKLLASRKSIVFTLMTLLLLLPIFALTTVYLERSKAVQSLVVEYGVGDKLRYVEDDIDSNIYSDILDVRLNKIERGAGTNTSYANVSFDQFILEPGRDNAATLLSYENFIEESYAAMNNLDISITGLSTNFTILPYNTTFDVQGQNMYVYTMQDSANPMQGIAISIQVTGQNSSACIAPTDDGVSYTAFDVTYYFSGGSGGSCQNSIHLNPSENNDASGRQFYLETTNPNGSIEIKYGQIYGMSSNGIVLISTQNITANITQLDLIYSTPATLPPGEKIIITGAVTGTNLSIISAVEGFQKDVTVLLAEE